MAINVQVKNSLILLKYTKQGMIGRRGPMGLPGQDAVSWTVSVTMDGAPEGTCRINLYKDGVLCSDETHYAAVHVMGTRSQSYTLSEAYSRNISGSYVFQYEDARAVFVVIYEDSFMETVLTANTAQMIRGRDMKQLNCPALSFTYAQWAAKGTAGTVVTWTTGSAYDNTTLEDGDMVCIIGSVSDQLDGAGNPIKGMIIGQASLAEGETALESVSVTSHGFFVGQQGNKGDTGEKGETGKGAYYVKGTQTAATGAWTGVLDEADALYNGLSIDYWLPYDGSGNATLELTLKDGSSTGAIPCYNNGLIRLTTQVAANNICHLTYQTINISGTEYSAWWRSYDKNDNTTDISNLLEGNGAYQAASVVYRYQLLFQTDANTLTPLNNANNVNGTTKTMLTDVAFDPFGKIYYYNSTTTVAAGANMTTTLFYHRVTIDLRYTLNCGSTLTAHRDIYLKVVPQANGMVKLAADPCWTQELPSSNDGYWYIFLGRAQSAYQFTLYTEHPVYYHDGTEIRKLENIDLASASSAGLMSAADKAKLDGIGGSGYTLPTASAETLGGVKVGTNLSIEDGVLSATDTTYSEATSSAAGLMSAADKAAVDAMNGIQVRPDYIISTTDLTDGTSKLASGKLYFYYKV